MKGGVSMWGNEERTDRKILAKGTQLWHNSDTQIRYFEEKGIPESTCFFTEDRGNGKYRYLITLKKDVMVSYFGPEEVRFDPTTEKIAVMEIGTNRNVSVCNYFVYVI
jgi:hypothetical protein